MGEHQTPHFYDFGIFERVLSSHNQLFLFLDTPGHLKQIKKILGRFEASYFLKSQNLELQVVCYFWKRRAPKNPDDPFHKILKISDMGSMSIKEHEIDIW